MPNQVFYSNVAQQTTLSGNISSGSTSINVAATTGFPGSFPYVLALDYGAATEELVSVTAAAGTTLTVTRGYGGTSAQSHSLGAVVRHTYNAQDATDFRTHEASTGAVHGLTGSIVGTSDTQSLSNKTLTNPTINAAAVSGTFTGNPTLSGNATFSGTLTGAGAMAGTWSGTPTFSGDVTHSGQIVLTNLLRGSRANDTDSMYESRKTGDANAKWFVTADGHLRWGPGTTGYDVEMRRDGAGVVGVGGTIQAVPTGTGLDGLGANLPLGTSGDLLNLRVNSSIQSAMGNDGQFRIYGGNTTTPYTPVWANIGTATFTTNVGWYWRLGKMIFFTAHALINAAGSGTGTAVTVTAPTNPDRTTRQLIPLHGETIKVNGGTGAQTIRNGQGVIFTGGAGAVIDRLRVTDSDGDGDNNIFGVDLISGGQITLTGWYREA